MSHDNSPRPGEIAVPLPDSTQACLYFIGTIRTPFKARQDCPRQGAMDGPLCRLEVDPRWEAALAGLQAGMEIQVLYWMHEARRDLVAQNPGNRGNIVGTFSVRSPARPNPIASSMVVIEAIHGAIIEVRGLDCLDGTPLLDIKPPRCPQA